MIGVLRWLAIITLTVFLNAGVALSQDTTTVDYTAWTQTAQRAEDAISASRASDAAFETLRSEIASWRQRFLTAQSANSQRIATLQSQIASLGAAPSEGQTESEDIATRRQELNDQLAELRTPIVTAEEAYSRANGMIGEIDQIIRARQTDALLRLGPSPLNPAHWPQALEDLIDSLATPVEEVISSWNSPVQRAQFRSNLPIVFLLVALALVLGLRGRGWVHSAVNKLRDMTRRGTGVWSFLVSLGLIFLPYVGLLALSKAVTSTGLLGASGTLFLEQVPEWGLTLLVVRWLGEQTFARDSKLATLALDDTNRTEGRFYITSLGFLMVARQILDTLLSIDGAADTTPVVLGFPIVLIAGLILFRLGLILNRFRLADEFEQDGETQDLGTRLAKFLGRGAIVVGIAGPLMYAIGYVRAGDNLVSPTVWTLGLLCALLVAQRFIKDVYRLITNKSDEDGDSLIPVLAGYVLVFLSAPLAALIWGARVADLTEMWTRFREGFSIGDTRISPTDFLTFIVIFAVGYSVTRLLQSGLRGSVLPKTRIDIGGQNAIVSGVGYVGIFLAALIAISAAGLDLSSLAIVAGALSVGIGFGLQNIVSNFVSGIILLIERPISEGDWIEVGGQMGYVRDISVRSTRIETFDRTDVIVPNADLVSGTVTNYTRGNVIGRVIVPVGVAYGTDTRKVEDILRRIARDHPMVLMNPEPGVVFKGFGADSLDFEIRAILRDVNYVLSVKSDMNHEIAKRFADEGIEIPFAQRDVWLRNPEVLQQDSQKPKDPSEGEQE